MIQQSVQISEVGWVGWAPKAALPEDKGPGTRPNRLTRKPKRAFIVPIHY